MNLEAFSIGVGWLLGLVGVAAIVLAISYGINMHDKAETKKIEACVSNDGQWVRNGSTHECVRSQVSR